MNNQSKCSKEQLNIGNIQTVITLNDIPLEVRKKAADEPIYITHM